MIALFTATNELEVAVFFVVAHHTSPTHSGQMRHIRFESDAVSMNAYFYSHLNMQFSLFNFNKSCPRFLKLKLCPFWINVSISMAVYE